MKTSIDETELARLESTIDHYAKVVQLNNVSIPHQIIKSVPALVAEVRRLRADIKKGSEDYCNLMDYYDAQFVRAEKLREKVEAWEWFEECFEIVQWLFSSGPRNLEGFIEATKSANAAREAVHADRE